MVDSFHNLRDEIFQNETIAHVSGDKRAQMERIRKPYAIHLLLIAGAMIATPLLAPGVSKINSKQKVVAEATAPTVAFSIVGNARIVSGPWHSRAVTVFVQPEDFTVEGVQSKSVLLPVTTRSTW